MNCTIEYILGISILLVLSSCISPKITPEAQEVRQVKPIDSRVHDVIIGSLEKSFADSHDWERAVVLLNYSTPKPGVVEIRAVLLYKNDLKYYLNNKLDCIYGYDHYGDLPVFILGTTSRKYYTVGGHHASFDYLKPRMMPEPIDGIPYPPRIIEPEVFVYGIKDKNIYFKEKGLLGLFD